jgi:hypothetical protein
LEFVHPSGFLISRNGLICSGFFDGFGFVLDFFKVLESLFERIIGLQKSLLAFFLKTFFSGVSFVSSQREAV